MIPFCLNSYTAWTLDWIFVFWFFLFCFVSKQTFMKQLKKSSKKTKEIPTLQLPEEEVLKEPLLVAEEISRDDLRTGKFQYFTNTGQYPSGSFISLYLSSSKKIWIFLFYIHVHKFGFSQDEKVQREVNSWHSHKHSRWKLFIPAGPIDNECMLI